MKRTYMQGMLAALIGQSGHPGIKTVEPWDGPTKTHSPAGLQVTFTDGSAHYIKIVCSSGPGGGHPGGPDEFNPADLADVDVSNIGADGPAKAGVFARYLADLAGSVGHPDVAQVEPVAPYGQVAVTARLTDGHRLTCMFVRALGPGGRQYGTADYAIADPMR